MVGTHVFNKVSFHVSTSYLNWYLKEDRKDIWRLLSVCLTFTFHFHALEKEMATHSSVLAWRITGTGEPGGLPSMWSHRVGHDWSDLAAAQYGHENFLFNYNCIMQQAWNFPGAVSWERHNGIMRLSLATCTTRIVSIIQILAMWRLFISKIGIILYIFQYIQINI